MSRCKSDWHAGRLHGLQEAADLAYTFDAAKFRDTYDAQYNRKRYDVAGVERCGDRCMNIQAEDVRDAILALMDAPAERLDDKSKGAL